MLDAFSWMPKFNKYLVVFIDGAKTTIYAENSREAIKIAQECYDKCQEIAACDCCETY